MGSGDSKRQRPTLRFDSAQLARLARAAAPAVDPAHTPEPTAEPKLASGTRPPEAHRSRTATMHDPMTMALLAEVARTTRTVDFDLDKLEQALAEHDEAPQPSPHPHIKRR
jgi:hypothetical protein